MNCFSQHAPEIQTAAAIVQAISAGIIVWLTIRLARSTETYAGLTRDSLNVAREQFEREWLPYWHLLLTHDTVDMNDEIRLAVTNLSRNSARVTHLFMRIETEPGSLKQWVLDMPLPGLERESFNATEHLRETIQPNIMGGSWQGVVEVRVAFVVAGADAPRPSSWFPFKIAVTNDKIVGVRPRVPYIASSLSE